MSKGRHKPEPLKPGLSLSRRHMVRRLISWMVLITLLGGLVYLTVIYMVQRQSAEVVRQASSTTDTSLQTEAEDSDKEAPAKEEEARSAHEPHGLSIPTLGIDGANVMAVGVESSGEMAAPNTNHGVGWYRGSDTPGGSGALLMNGHVGLENETAVFSDLHKLTSGDEIIITDGQGGSYTYTVYRVEQLPTEDVDMRKMMRSVNPSRQGLNIITCAGAFVESANTYTDRVLVYAVLADT